MPFRKPREVLENTVYLSLGSISCSLGSKRALSWGRPKWIGQWGASRTLTSALHLTPLALTVSITLSTNLSRFLWFALRLFDIRHGIFLYTISSVFSGGMFDMLHTIANQTCIFYLVRRDRTYPDNAFGSKHVPLGSCQFPSNMAITANTTPATPDANGASSANEKGTTLKFASSDIILPPPDIKSVEFVKPKRVRLAKPLIPRYHCTNCKPCCTLYYPSAIRGPYSREST